MKIFPSKKQWEKWSLPSKLTAIGAYIAIIALVLSVVFFVISLFNSESINKSDLEKVVKESAHIEQLLNNKISDIFFTVNLQKDLEYEKLGFRILTENFGTLYFYFNSNNLIIEDGSGSLIKCSPTVGSDLNKGRAFYSVDLKQAVYSIPEHKINYVTLKELSNSTFDFITKKYTPPYKFYFNVSVCVIVSGWMISCGSFSLDKIPVELPFQQRNGFFAFELEHRRFEFHTIDKTYAAKGNSWENDLIEKTWQVLLPEMNATREFLDKYNWPSSFGEFEPIRISFAMPIALNQFIYSLGYEKLNGGRLLMSKTSKGTSMIVASIREPSIINSLINSQTDERILIPMNLKLIASAILCHWKVYFENSPSNTEVPLETLIILCPLNKELFVWGINCYDIRHDWETSWVPFENNKPKLTTKANSFLDNRTIITKHVNYE